MRPALKAHGAVDWRSDASSCSTVSSPVAGAEEIDFWNFLIREIVQELYCLRVI